ncbi:MAG: hypothetical protein MAG581_01689 [Deltaproteobacteria bacterium]|nr:hypothetical protein [Deltaproteobacteria bacterium]
MNFLIQAEFLYFPHDYPKNLILICTCESALRSETRAGFPSVDLLAVPEID